MILHSRESTGAVNLTLLVNPMMRWIWLGGWVAGLGATLALIPAQRRTGAGSQPSVDAHVAPPHWALTNRQSKHAALRAADDR